MHPTTVEAEASAPVERVAPGHALWQGQVADWLCAIAQVATVIAADPSHKVTVEETIAIVGIGAVVVRHIALAARQRRGKREHAG